jgi:hypothetical protein
MYDLLVVLKERDLGLGKEFWQKGNVRLRRRKCYDRTKIFSLESSL